MEQSRKTKIYMGIPTTGKVIDSQGYILRELEEIYGDRIEFVYPKVCVRRIFHDFARNEIVREFLETDCDILWFLDSDVAPAKHVLDLVTEHGEKWYCAGAPYPVFMTPAGSEDREILFAVYKCNPEGALIPCTIPYEGTDWVSGLATGCLFIKREVFSMIEAPYFAFSFDEKSRNPTLGEDISFVKKVNEKGIQFFTDYSMVCEHVKDIGLLELNNYAIRYVNRALERHHEQIKEQVAAAVKAAYRSGIAVGKSMAQEAPKAPSGLILPASFK